jgi:hypothetical protein
MNEVIKGVLAKSYRHLEYLDMSSINKYPFLFFYIYKGLRSALGAFMFFLNDILTYSIFYEEYECHHSIVLEALRENHLFVKLMKRAF